MSVPAPVPSPFSYGDAILLAACLASVLWAGRELVSLLARNGNATSAENRVAHFRKRDTMKPAGLSPKE